MAPVVLALLLVAAIQAAAIVALLVQTSRLSRVDRAQRDREERLIHMADHSPAMLWTAQADSKLDYLNRTCSEFTGQPIEKLREEGWLDFVHPHDLDHVNTSFARAIEARTGFLVEYRLRRADGAYRWLLATGIPKFGPDGSFAGYVGCDVDITERKDAEDRIRERNQEIQHLAGRLIEAQDAERARIARDLHDDVSQQLAGLSIALSAIKHRVDELQATEELRADVRGLHQRTITLARSVRHLSHDLHPTVLRHAGLVSALNSYCAELERSHGRMLTCSAEGDLTSIGPDVALCLYRIAQEALRNVIAHAEASQVQVRLLLSSGRVVLTIADDGRGFDVGRSFKNGMGLGLVSITERARLLGGTVDIVTESKKGTLVRVLVPARMPVNEDAGVAAGGGPRELGPA